ncbi:DUF1971 domain-containing protein [Acaryochloris marina]|uniref:DUF1971 domain-containing protein n=1 Tax=Acaryochloris marina TaxID=155978 RepID=UPI0008FFBDB0|nr:DUF1971 domain-containing protein [Acaryochloris marina]
MKILPKNVTAYRQTSVFTQDTIPNALLHSHTTREGSWGKLCVISGQLRYQILTNPPEEHVISSELPGIIEPKISHKVEPIGSVEFYVEFHHQV